MIFNQIAFFVFFALFFPLYWWINRRFSIRIRNFLIIVASYIFYGWWDPRFLILIFISSLSDFLIGIQLDKTTDVQRRKWLLRSSVFINLGILGYFKYFNFFIDSLNSALSSVGLDPFTSSLDILLPVGISFYTFQTLSYTLDIYHDRLKPTRDPFAFFAFVSFFPQLVAGPIERAKHLLPQFYERKKFNYEQTVSGLRLALWGLFQKVVIADNFGLLADTLLDPKLNNGASSLLGIFLFTFQIYLDFAGYSNMAVGISRTLGVDLMTNFKTPYFASSFAEFWRRWHISLSTWFRDYVYIPLGGNRKGELSMYRNLLITFLLSGLWHGASVRFLIWGALHGLCLIIEKRWNLRSFLRWPIVLTMVMLMWIPFRATDTSHMLNIFQTIFSPESWNGEFISNSITDFSFNKGIVLSIVFLLFIFIEKQFGDHDFDQWVSRFPRWTRRSVYYALIILLLILSNFDMKPHFIYFQF